jgi:hypothetical protein
METKIQMTPVYSLLIVTNWEETRWFIISKRNGKEDCFFFSERTFQNIQDWDNRELEAHIDAVTYSVKELIESLGKKLLSGEYVPEQEIMGYSIQA